MNNDQEVINIRVIKAILEQTSNVCRDGCQLFDGCGKQLGKLSQEERLTEASLNWWDEHKCDIMGFALTRARARLPFKEEGVLTLASVIR